MYKFIIAVGITALVGFGVSLIPNEYASEGNTIETQEIIKEVTPEPVDVIDSAKAELERINLELDAEEIKLLEEIAERETRLESIRETRTSF